MGLKTVAEDSILGWTGSTISGGVPVPHELKPPVLRPYFRGSETKEGW